MLGLLVPVARNFFFHARLKAEHKICAKSARELGRESDLCPSSRENLSLLSKLLEASEA
jgi:hypothetical protein